MDVTHISCGEYHVAVVLDSGEVFTWGRSGNRLGYSCDEGRQTHPRPVEALGRRKVRYYTMEPKEAQRLCRIDSVLRLR